MDSYDSTQDTLAHIARVGGLVEETRRNLRQRAGVHDLSKLQSPEKAAFDRLGALRLSEIVYGSEEYKAALAAEQPAIQHHYEHNPHHPEYHEDGVAGMSLLDLVEMLADWKAAGERVKDGDIMESIDYNVGRFGIDEQLASILRNTVQELNW